MILADPEARPRAAAPFGIGLSGLHDPREHADLPGAVGADERLQSGGGHDHDRRAPRDRVREACQQPIGDSLRVQPADRRRRLRPDVSYLEQPGATEPAREQRAESGHGKRWRGHEHHVGARQGDCSRSGSGDELGVVRHAGVARTVDAARRPDPVVRDALDRLTAEARAFGTPDGTSPVM